ncbi:MAG: glutamate--cysteine ligase [Pseudomonadota bacterium]
MNPSDCDISETSFNRGIERETLRVTSDGELAMTPHPRALGAKLTHPCITTDFCESQLELITPVFQTINDVLAELTRIHQYVHHTLDNELLWPASMPCVLPQDSDIPLADYGSSNVAIHKKTYRSGLGIRYGRSMQTISAVHYNFSPDDTVFAQLADHEHAADTKEFRNERYFGLMRNFREVSWLPVYLFGASPAVASSFVRPGQHSLSTFGDQTLIKTHATSLRNGNLGYQSETQNGLMDVCYNSIENYITALATGITTPFEPYQRLNTNATKILQLNSSLIQSEAEFYTTIRAKCTPDPGENFLRALNRKGVDYVEIRLLDLNPFTAIGVDADTLRFMDLLLIHCLANDSPSHHEERCKAVEQNLQYVVQAGRQGTETASLRAPEGSASLASWGEQIIDLLAPWAEKLGGSYMTSLEAQRSKIRQPALTPSAEMLNRMQSGRTSFVEFSTELAQEQHRNMPAPDETTLATFRDFTERSFEMLADRESTHERPFSEFLADLNAEYHDILSTLSVQSD